MRQLEKNLKQQCIIMSIFRIPQPNLKDYQYFVLLSPEVPLESTKIACVTEVIVTDLLF